MSRRPLLLIVSTKSLLPILEPARDVRSLPQRFAHVVAERLVRLGIDRPLIEAEVAAMGDVLVAPTNDRSVLGTMNDFARMLGFDLGERPGFGEEELHRAEALLAETPCRPDSPDCLWPEKAAPELLASRWGSG